MRRKQNGVQKPLCSRGTWQESVLTSSCGCWVRSGSALDNRCVRVGVCNSWLVRHVLCSWRHPPLPSSLTPEKERGRLRLGQDVEVKGVSALGHRHGIFYKRNFHVMWVSGKAVLCCSGHLMSYLVSVIDWTLELHWDNWLLFGYGSHWRQMMKYPISPLSSRFFCK